MFSAFHDHYSLDHLTTKLVNIFHTKPNMQLTDTANIDGAAQSILAHIQANDGQGVSQIASATGTPLPAAKKAISVLLASGQISKSGQKRGTRYHAGRGAGRMMRAAKRTKRGKRRGRKAKAA